MRNAIFGIRCHMYPMFLIHDSKAQNMYLHLFIIIPRNILNETYLYGDCCPSYPRIAAADSAIDAASSAWYEKTKSFESVLPLKQPCRSYFKIRVAIDKPQ